MSMFGTSGSAAQAAVRSLRPYGEFVEFGFEPRLDACSGPQFAGRAQIFVAGNVRVPVQDADGNGVDARRDGARAIEVGRIVPLLVPVDLGEARRNLETLV